jgi:hypothetical protein
MKKRKQRELGKNRRKKKSKGLKKKRKTENISILRRNLKSST